ncbi:MAG: hypothetical protein ABSB11_07450 [Sedimentisphaerales bacterium]
MKRKKRETQAQRSRPRFLPKGHRLSLRKAFQLWPRTCFGKAAAVIRPQLLPASAPFGEASRTRPKQSGAFFQLKYTFCFQQAKMDEAEIF